MDYKREAIDKLRSYTLKRDSLERSEREIRLLKVELASMKSASTGCTPVQGGASRQEDAVINNIARRTELERAMKLTREWLAIVEDALGALTEEERMILDRMYIHSTYDSVRRLCEGLHIEKSSVYRRRDEALRRFTMALYGMCEL